MEKPRKIDPGSRLFLTATPNLSPDARLSSGPRDRLYQWVFAKRNREGGFEDIAPHALMELTWEIVRLREFSHLPSRLECLFLWMDEATARGWHYRTQIQASAGSLDGYRKRHEAPGISGLYEVEAVKVSRVFAGNMNLISYLNDGETVYTLMERARQYWRGEKVTNTAEILLEGSVVVRRNLLARRFEEIRAISDLGAADEIKALMEWDPLQNRLRPESRTGKPVYNLEGMVRADDRLPVKVAGWVGLRLEEGREPARCVPNQSPILLRPGNQVEIFAKFSGLPEMTVGTRYQPVLLCDRAAAHYWQLDSYWDGQIEGEWQTLPQSP